MTQETTTAAMKAVKGLEEKGRKLTEVVVELEELSAKLNNLDDSVQNVNKVVEAAGGELSKLQSQTNQMKDDLVSELRVRIASSSAEQISRVKDANERLLKLEEQIKSNINEVRTLNGALNKGARTHTTLLVILLLLSAAIFAKLMGFF